MSSRDHQPGVVRSRRGRGRRARVVLGVAGIAGLLGTGAYTITDHLMAGRTTVSGQTQPLTAVPTRVPSATSSPGTAKADGLRPSLDPKVAAEINEARRKMAKDGVRVQPALPQSTAPVADIQTSTEGSLKSGGIVRTETARGDLTGQRELALVAGGVTKHRNASCSQTIRPSVGAPPKKVANLLICWRTSATKSVISVVVDPKGHPSRAKALGLLEDKWRGLR